MTTLDTTSGPVRGAEDGPVLRFAGIPYAAPPVGELRFRPPQPPPPWEEVRDATEFGPIAPQNPDMMNMFLGVEREPIDEDCLYLNVWTPSVEGKRPVMVWIHGGAFILGSGSNFMYPGRTFAERGDVVMVTINYRLGELGFLELGWLDPGYAGSGNNGILDQIAALRWVRDNIAAFGGDPDDVTIFGESAGGMSVATLLAAPDAEGLFHKAIAQSGAAQSLATVEQAERVARDYVARLHVETVDDLRALPIAELLAVQAALMAKAMTDTAGLLEEGAMSGLPFRPIGDGRAVPASVLAAVRSGSATGVPLLIGTTRDEWKLFALMDPEVVDDRVLRRRLEALTGDADKALAVYGEAHPGLEPPEVFGAVLTDLAFRYPAVQLAEAQAATGTPAFVYLFTWASPVMGGALGSCHAIELPFVFGHVDNPLLAAFVGVDPPADLATRVQSAWISFAREGVPTAAGLPEWPPYDPDRRATMELGLECRVVDDPGAAEREFWAATA
jgi:para-nitrobenzyl esterase